MILFTGDAYIDHPSFGAAVVGRLLEAEGYRVAIVPQPNWRDDLRISPSSAAPLLRRDGRGDGFDGEPLTANIRLRSNDAYTPGGKAGFRPDYAVKTYTQILKRLFPRTPVVIGGIEASLRRLTHYDYWSDSPHPRSSPTAGPTFDLRHGRAGDSTGGAGDEQRIQRQVVAKYPTGGIHGRPQLCGSGSIRPK